MWLVLFGWFCVPLGEAPAPVWLLSVGWDLSPGFSNAILAEFLHFCYQQTSVQNGNLQGPAFLWPTPATQHHIQYHCTLSIFSNFLCDLFFELFGTVLSNLSNLCICSNFLLWIFPNIHTTWKFISRVNFHIPYTFCSIGCLVISIHMGSSQGRLVKVCRGYQSTSLINT
jgi:hypothetical protein